MHPKNPKLSFSNRFRIRHHQSDVPVPARGAELGWELCTVWEWHVFLVFRWQPGILWNRRVLLRSKSNQVSLNNIARCHFLVAGGPVSALVPRNLVAHRYNIWVRLVCPTNRADAGFTMLCSWKLGSWIKDDGESISIDKARLKNKKKLQTLIFLQERNPAHICPGFLYRQLNRPSQSDSRNEHRGRLPRTFKAPIFECLVSVYKR